MKAGESNQNLPRPFKGDFMNMNAKGICTAQGVEEQRRCIHFRQSCIAKNQNCADLGLTFFASGVAHNSPKECRSKKANNE